MSRVVRFHRLGGPEVLQIEEIPDGELPRKTIGAHAKRVRDYRSDRPQSRRANVRAGVYLQDTGPAVELNGLARHRQS